MLLQKSGDLIYHLKKINSRIFEYSAILIIAVVCSGLSNISSMPVLLLDSLNTGSTVYFDYGQSELKPEAYGLLDRLAEELKRSPGAKIEITGHTDNSGSELFNYLLALKRAETVKNYLISKGAEQENIGIRSGGFKFPARENDSIEHMAENRRVEFTWKTPAVIPEQKVEIYVDPVTLKPEDEAFVNTALKTETNSLKGNFTARDSSGITVKDLKESDIDAELQWTEQGKPLKTPGTVTLFPIDDKKKLAFTFTMDYSGSMYEEEYGSVKIPNDKTPFMEKAVSEFISHINEDHYAKIIKFGSYIEPVTNYTKDKNILKNAVTSNSFNMQGTALYGSIYTALKDTVLDHDPTVMKAVIAFTDGEENSSRKINKDSIYKNSIDKGIKVFTVGLISVNKHSNPIMLRNKGEADLYEISKKTGGFYYWANNAEALPIIYRQIYDQIMNSYNISIIWNGDKLPPKGTQVTAMLRINIKGIFRTIYKKYVME